MKLAIAAIAVFFSGLVAAQSNTPVFHSPGTTSYYTGSVTYSRDVNGILTFADNTIFVPTNVATAAAPTAAQWKQAYQDYANQAWSYGSGAIAQYVSWGAYDTNGHTPSLTQYNNTNWGAGPRNTDIAPPASITAAKYSVIATINALNAGTQQLRAGAYSNPNSTAYGQDIVDSTFTQNVRSITHDLPPITSGYSEGQYYGLRTTYTYFSN